VPTQPEQFGNHSGVGSLPGTDATQAIEYTFEELVDRGIPYLPELPSRGPGADLIGRSAALLVDLAVDLQPSGWRLVPRAGRDLERARSWWRQDLDLLAEIADGYTGPLKTQVAGPWTLAASLRLPRLERAVVDRGACLDLVESLAEGTAHHVAEIRRLVPGAQVVLQVDEPSAPAVLEGTLPTASGFGRIRSVEEHTVLDGLRKVIRAAKQAGAVDTLVHCCAAAPPIALLADCGAGGISLDTTLLGPEGWEKVAVAVERGLRLWAGSVPTGSPGSSVSPSRTAPDPSAVAQAVAGPWTEVGLPVEALSEVIITPTCGLAAATPTQACTILRSAARASRILVERAHA
jgi:hypothetical protein